MRKSIYAVFPMNLDCYTKILEGGGWVLFDEPPDQKCMEMYSDYNSNLANLFYCVESRVVAFLQELGFLPLDSRNEFTVIKDFTGKQMFDTSFLKGELQLAEHPLLPPESEGLKVTLSGNTEVADVKRAAASLKLICYSYGSGCTSYGYRPFDARKCFAAIWQASYRLTDTVIGDRDFETLTRQYDRESAFFYCNLPYHEAEGHYAVAFHGEDHTRLRGTLAEAKGRWMASCNDCELIRGLYTGYTITAVTRINNLAQRYDDGCKFPETIIINCDPGELEWAKPQRLHLFALCGEEGDDCYEVMRW